MPKEFPEVRDIDPRTPLRLAVAAKLAFPDGSMTASGLRREHLRGRLIIERIAGKDFTTLANINLMRERCLVQAKGLAFTGATPASKDTSLSRKPSGSSETAAGISPQDALRTRLKKAACRSRASLSGLHRSKVSTRTPPAGYRGHRLR
jgi:hypothetical protein